MSTRDDVLREDLEANGFTAWTWRDQLSPTSRCRIMRFTRRLRRLEQLGDGHGLLVRVKTSLLWRVHARDAAILGFTIPLARAALVFPSPITARW